MRASKLSFAVTGIGLVVAFAGCGSGASNSGSGGSNSGSGGRSNGSGGASTGGSTSSGGASSGGSSSGGATATGGSASGGASSGGNTASGGSGSGGASSGGTSGTGGAAVGGKGGAASGGGNGGGGKGGGAGGGTSGGTFTLTSPDHVDGAHFDAKFTCAAMNGTFGAGVNPELDWTVPTGTMSFAITFIDTTIGENSPMGQHWAIWNIPAAVTKFPQGTMTLTGDLATAKQNGKFLSPCAQSLVNNMDDQYEFTVFALPTTTLNITGTSVANALAALKTANPIGTAKLRGHAGLKGK